MICFFFCFLTLDLFSDFFRGVFLLKENTARLSDILEKNEYKFVAFG